MKHNNVIAIDLAKNIFQVCVMTKHNKIISNKPMSRAKLIAWLPQQSESLVAMESCGGASYWARLAKSLGHDVLVMPARQVKAFRTGQKTDANDAVAIAVASQSPNIHPARYLSSEQQCLQAIEKMRDMLSKQKSQLSNQVRGLLLEFGLVINKGSAAFKSRIPEILEDAENELSIPMRQSLFQLWEFYRVLEEQYQQIDRRLVELINQNEECQRLMKLEGVGPISAIKLNLRLAQDHFDKGRQASACIGLTPQQHSSGGKVRLGPINKVTYDRSLRSVLFLGARAAVSKLKTRPAKTEKERWMKALVERRGINCAAIALANKNVRTAHALLKNKTDYVAVPLHA
jgi:transposase